MANKIDENARIAFSLLIAYLAYKSAPTLLKTIEKVQKEIGSHWPKMNPIQKLISITLAVSTVAPIFGISFFWYMTYLDTKENAKNKKQKLSNTKS